MGTQVYAHKVKLTLLQVVGCLGLISSVLNHTQVVRNQKLVEHSYLPWQKAFAFLNHATQQIGPNPLCHQVFRVVFSSFSGWIL